MWLEDQYLRPGCVDSREGNKSSKQSHPVIDVSVSMQFWHLSNCKISGEMAGKVAETAEEFPAVLVGRSPTSEDMPVYEIKQV